MVGVQAPYFGPGYAQEGLISVLVVSLQGVAEFMPDHEEVELVGVRVDEKFVGVRREAGTVEEILVAGVYFKVDNSFSRCASDSVGNSPSHRVPHIRRGDLLERSRGEVETFLFVDAPAVVSDVVGSGETCVVGPEAVRGYSPPVNAGQKLAVLVVGASC